MRRGKEREQPKAKKPTHLRKVYVYDPNSACVELVAVCFAGN